MDEFVSTCVAAVYKGAATVFRESLVVHRDGTQGVDLDGDPDTQGDVQMGTIFFMINNPQDPTDRWLQNQFRTT